MDIFEYLNDIVEFFQLPIWGYLIRGIIFIVIIIWLSFVYWTYRDARLRNTSAIFWALVVLAFNYLGLILYLILRPPEYIDDVVERELEIRRMDKLLNSKNELCPACSKDIEGDFLICPHCRKKLKNSCINCAKPLELDWKVCPYCKVSQ